jgi:hypothetical protein
MRCSINASRPISRVLYGRGSSPRRDGHSSGTPVAGRLEQPTRAARPTDKALRRENAPRVAPIRFCSRRGLPCRRRYRPRGALLPHPFTLAFSLDGLWGPRSGGLLSVALSLGSPPPDVIRRRIRMEPGLSSAFEAAAVRPTGWRGHMGPKRRRSSEIRTRAVERTSVREPPGKEPAPGLVHCSFTRIMGLCRAGRWAGRRAASGLGA